MVVGVCTPVLQVGSAFTFVSIIYVVDASTLGAGKLVSESYSNPELIIL